MSPYTIAPAYTAVAATRHALQPPLHHPPPPQAQHQARVQWPQEVRDYVQRCFAPEAAIPEISRADMEAKLKRVITEAAEGGTLSKISWETLPLPQQLIQQERVQAAQNYWGQNYQTFATNLNTLPASGLKKRRHDEFSSTPGSTGSTTPPWRKTKGTLEDRVHHPAKATRAEKKLKKSQISPLAVSSKFKDDLERRRQRFEGAKSGKRYNRASSSDDDDDDNDEPRSNGPIVGTSEELLKNYFRLTRPPKPHEVRPQHVLEKTMVLIKKKWRDEGDYVYICDQFKSMRQDLTVQHIKNSFTVSVYELHARIALEKGDLGEYNQCQTQLKALYSLNLGGHPAEFLAYRILYLIHTANRTGMNSLLSELTPTDKEQPAVKHALETRSAIASGNYHRLFRLYIDVPNMGAYLMDMFILRERLSALAKICKTYKTRINNRFLSEELGFESYQESAQFILDHGAESAFEQVDDEGTGSSDLFLNPTAASHIFDAAQKSAFQKIDIKGQI